MISVLTNESAILARFNSLQNISEFNLAAERLSSGKRINSGSDDAAGNSVALKMDALIDGKNIAINTIGDGIALLEIQDSGLAEVQNIVLQLRELAVHKWRQGRTRISTEAWRKSSLKHLAAKLTIWF